LSTAVDNSEIAELQAENLRLRQAAGLTRGGTVDDLVQGKDAAALQSQYLTTLDAWTERLENPASTEVPPELAEIEAEIAKAFRFVDELLHNFETGMITQKQYETAKKTGAYYKEYRAAENENAALFSDYQNQTTDIQNRLHALAQDSPFQWDHITLLMAKNAIRFVEVTYSMPISFWYVEDDDSKMEIWERLHDKLRDVANPWEDHANAGLRKLLAAPQWSPIHYQACALLQKTNPSAVAVLTGKCDNPGQQVPPIPLTTALAHLRKSGAAPSARDLPFLLALANNAVQAHWSEGMVGLLEMAVSLEPDNPVVLNLLGLAHFYSESPNGKENAHKILAHAATKHPYRPEIQKSLFWLAENPTQAVTALTKMIALQGQELASGWTCETDDCKTTLSRLKSAQRAVRAEERRAKREIEAKQRAESLSGSSSITLVIKRYKNHIKVCYDQALGRNRDTKGRVEIEFSVAGGTVQTASIAKNDTGDDELGTCISKKVKALKFDPSVEAEVIYPFVLSSH
jgi:hypothetical protein